TQRPEGRMCFCRFVVASLTAIATFAALAESGRAEEEGLKVAVGGRGIGETFVTEVGYKAGLSKPHNLALDIFYTDGGGETQQAVVSNSAQVGIASGFLGAIGVFAKGAPVRIIGGSYTGGAQVFWYVPAASPIKGPRDLSGKTVAYSNNGSSTHAGALALQKHYNVDFKPTPTGNAAATMTATMTGQVDVGWAGARCGAAELEAGKTRLIMKSSDAPDFGKQTSRVIIANATELKARPTCLRVSCAATAIRSAGSIRRRKGSMPMQILPSCRRPRPSAHCRNSCRLPRSIRIAFPGSRRGWPMPSTSNSSRRR